MGHLEAAHDALSICLTGRSLRLRSPWRKAQDFGLEHLDCHLDILEAGRLRPVVALADEVVDLALMVVQERLNVLLVQERCALRAGKNQVEMCEEADPRVEGHPAEDEVECVLNDGEAGQDNEVDQPWCKEGGI